MKIKKSEQGQALILLTIGIITLLGFTALAIDGGRVYSERRNIQGVADTTAMTGALYIAHHDGPVTTTIENEAIAAAEARAAVAGYSSGDVTVTISKSGDVYEVTAEIQSAVDPVMAQLIISGDLDVAARSVSRVHHNSSTVFALGQAFVSLNKTACKAIDHSGNAHVKIVNSGIFSNSSCNGTSKNNSSIAISGSASAEMTGDITAVGSIYVQKPGDVNVNAIVGGATQVDLPTLTEPDCTGMSTRSDSDDPLLPGIYPSGIHLSGNGSWSMEPGLYCLDGDLQINNGSLVGHGITFYLRNGAGLHINGGDIDLTAPSGDQWADSAGTYWNGMLVFQAYGNTNSLVMNGNANSYFEGTVFAPDALCRVNGTGNTTAVDMQVVCDTIDFIGTAYLNLEYNAATKYVPPPITTIDLVE